MTDFSEILKAVRCLSFSPDKQVEYLKNLGSYPSVDELALQFDDAFVSMKGELKESISELENLNSLLDSLNEEQDSDIWNAKSLISPPWEQIRLLSKKILVKMEVASQ
jgi:hypothetical protein